MEQDNPYEFASVMQNCLRLAFFSILIYPLLAILASVWVVHSWTLVSTSLASSFTTTFVLFQTQGKNPRKWWFLWLGPVIVMRSEHPEDKSSATEWLNDVCPEGFKEIMPGCFKFKYKAQAIVFKLTFG
jgi:hypothetical protein